MHKCFYRFEQSYRSNTMMLFKCEGCGNRVGVNRWTWNMQVKG